MNATHETLQPTAKPKAGSDRAFGLVFTAAFALVGLLPLLAGDEPRLWALAIAASLAAVSLLAPYLLRPLNHVWFRLGLLLHLVVSPIVLGILFFAAVTPTALIMRALGKDPLRLHRDPAATSYWIERELPGPPAETMKNQF